MDRNEVLERLDDQIERAVAAKKHMAKAKILDGVAIATDMGTVLRAAAELIRAGGWRSLHHGLDRDTALTCGKWEELPNGKHRWYCYQQKITPGYAMALGLTHYLPEPEPPAREVENG